MIVGLFHEVVNSTAIVVVCRVVGHRIICRKTYAKRILMNSLILKDRKSMKKNFLFMHFERINRMLPIGKKRNEPCFCLTRRLFDPGVTNLHSIKRGSP